MSQDYHQGLFGFSNVFDRSQQQQQQQQQLAQQIRRDKLRVEGFEPPPPLAGIEEEESTNGLPVYETAGMLSEMFNFQARNTDNSSGLLENQISQSYRNPRAAPQPSGSASAADWFLHRQGLVNEPAPAPAPTSTSSTLHMLLPNPPHGGFGQFSWGGNENNPNEIPGGVVEGLSLSLSSSLQHMNAANSEELRNMGEGGMLFFGQSMGGGGGGGGALHLQGGVVGPAGFGSSVGTHVSMLRSSKYAKAAQELLEEFCSVGRGQFKHNKFSRQNSNNNPSTNPIDIGVSSSSSSSLSAADRLEHQRRKVKLLSMLDEVDRRYNHYCEQMQMVVNSFDMVMGFGAAVPYTTLAQKAMSRHFRCLKDAIAAQLKQSCELLGEKDVGTSGVTKGETPRLRMLEQSLRQQRAFHQMGIMEQEAWRPQRGLPERSVNILRAWLFEHFLHPYPSDADKHLLARQTGLSRSQVSNWFINARVRLWKPMVEEMYQKEAKEETTEEQEQRDNSSSSEQIHDSAAGIMPAAESSAAASGFPASGEIDEASMIRFGAVGGDVSLTLGLRHAGNLPDKNPFSVRDFGGC